MAKYRYIAVYIIAGTGIFKRGGKNCHAQKKYDNICLFYTENVGVMS